MLRSFEETVPLSKWRCFFFPPSVEKPAVSNLQQLPFCSDSGAERDFHAMGHLWCQGFSDALHQF